MIYFTTKCLVQRVASDSLIERDLIYKLCGLPRKCVLKKRFYINFVIKRINFKLVYMVVNFNFTSFIKDLERVTRH